MCSRVAVKLQSILPVTPSSPAALIEEGSLEVRTGKQSKETWALSSVLAFTGPCGVPTASTLLLHPIELPK